MRGKLFIMLKVAGLSCVLVVLCASQIDAQPQRQDPGKIPVVYTMPGTDKVTAQRDITFKTAEGVALKMDVYYPPNAQTGAAKLPAVIFVNGVGIPGLKDWQVYVDWAKLVAASGMIAINHQSRQTEAMADAADLLNYVRSNAATLKVDENKIGIWSCSANVRVALPLTMREDRKYIRTAVFYYGIMDAPQMRFDVPMLVARAGQDVPNINGTIDAFVTRAIAQDAPLTFINYVEGQHAFDIFDNNDETRQIVRQTLDFLKFHLMKDEAGIPRKRAPTPGRFTAMIATDGIAKALQVFEEAKKTDPQGVLFRENVLNALGYQLLQDSRIREAVEIFKLNVAAYPQSANVYDSLGDAYEANGNKELAIQNTEKALELLDKDTTLDEAAKAPIRTSATDKLKRLKEQK